MACFRPIYGWQDERGGPLKFGAERKDHRRVDIPCGYCIGCKLQRSRAWAIRCMHEAQLSENNCFITLTYDDKHVQPGLAYEDFQAFLRLLRRRLGYFDVTRWQWLPRYFMCGEYGDKTRRPHFHAILFGTDFNDRQPFGTNTWRSPTLEKLWTAGYSTIGNATYEAAGYVARYATKKVYGPRAPEHYRRYNLVTGEVVDISPEFAHMSLKPGIGYEWFTKYWKETTLARDGVVRPGGKTNALPRYYMKLLKEQDSDLHDWRQYTRYIHSKEFEKDCTKERLEVREQCEIARLKQQIRNKI